MVLTLVAPILIPPVKPPVPMLTVVEPTALAIFTVEETPPPILTVCSTVELPIVMTPLPLAAPIVRAPVAPPFGIIVETINWVVVTLVALR